jgi:hypothetical protein
MTPDGVLTTVGVLAVGAATYIGSILFSPYIRCWWCGGKPRDHGLIFRRAYGKCRWCGGSGEKLRFGARVLGRGKK